MKKPGFFGQPRFEDRKRIDSLLTQFSWKSKDSPESTLMEYIKAEAMEKHGFECRAVSW